MSHLLQSQTENPLGLSAQVICVLTAPPAKMSFLLSFHTYTQVIPKFILMARSALVSDVKGCKSIVVSVPWTIHGVKCSQLPAQSREGWSLGSFCISAQAHEIKMSTFLNQRTNELKKK